MKPAAFAYHRPTTLDAAVTLLAELAPTGGRLLAGGQSLVPMMAFRLARPTALIDLNAIAALGALQERDGVLCVGAGTRHARFHRPVTQGPLGALLSDVVRHIAHYPIRTRGTFGGSLAHADPSSEWCLVAATLGGVMTARCPHGTRRIPAAAFFQSVMTTALRPDEILTEIALPLLPEGTRHGFAEFSRRKGDYAMAMALATFRLERGVIVAPRLGLGGVEAAPRRIAAAEALLEGAAPSAGLFDAAAETAAAAIDPLEDQQTDAAYRRDLARAMVREALVAA